MLALVVQVIAVSGAVGGHPGVRVRGRAVPNTLRPGEIAVEARVPPTHGRLRRLPEAGTPCRRLRHVGVASGRRDRRRRVRRAGSALTGSARTTSWSLSRPVLVGNVLDTDTAGEAARLAAEAAQPRTDHRGSAAYKRHVVSTFVTALLRRRRCGKWLPDMRKQYGGHPTGPHQQDTYRSAGSRSRSTESSGWSRRTRVLLAHLLREGLGLTGTHIGCDTQLRRLHGAGGRHAVKSCTMLAVQADGRSGPLWRVRDHAAVANPVQEGSRRNTGCMRFLHPGDDAQPPSRCWNATRTRPGQVRWALSATCVAAYRLPEIVKAVLWAAAKRQPEAHVTHGLDEIGIGGLGATAGGWRTTGSSAAGATTPTTSSCGIAHMEILRSPVRTPGIKSIAPARRWQIPRCPAGFDR